MEHKYEPINDRCTCGGEIVYFEGDDVTGEGCEVECTPWEETIAQSENHQPMRMWCLTCRAEGVVEGYALCKECLAQTRNPVTKQDETLAVEEALRIMRGEEYA